MVDDRDFIGYLSHGYRATGSLNSSTTSPLATASGFAPAATSPGTGGGCIQDKGVGSPTDAANAGSVFEGSRHQHERICNKCPATNLGAGNGGRWYLPVNRRGAEIGGAGPAMQSDLRGDASSMQCG